MVRTHQLGDAHVDRSASARTGFTAPFQELISAIYCGVPAANAASAVAQRTLEDVANA
jgi:hypothetical protein